MKPSRLAPSIETLEGRIAPATLVSPTTLTYTDVDGDSVTVQITKGTLTAADFIFDTEFGAAGNQQLLRIDFAGDKDKARTDFTISVVPGPGDGLAHVGYIDATGIDLGDVTVAGDLGRIRAGDAAKTTAALGALTLQSLGIQPLEDTQETGGNLVSSLVGGIGTLTVAGDVKHALIDVDGSIGTIEVGGNITGGTDPMSGSIRSKGSISEAHVGGDLVGGDGDDSGQIFARHDIEVLTIDGSLVGGTLSGSLRSGQIAANDRAGQITIGGNIQGGAGNQSAQIASRDGITSLTVLGAMSGGDGFESAVVGSRGKIASVVVKGGITGGTGPSSGSILADSLIQNVVVGDSGAPADLAGGFGDRSGIIASTKGIGTVVIHGSVVGGDGDTSGAIGSTSALRSVTIDGDLQGGNGPRSGEIVSSASIGDVTVTGGIYGGQGPESGAVGSTGRIGSISVGDSFLGNIGSLSGWIISGASIGSIDIGGDAGTSGSFSGFIECTGRIGSISIAGNIGGVESQPISIFAGKLGSLDVGHSIFSSISSASIHVRKTIGSIAVGDDVVGSSQGFSRLSISAGTSIDSISIGGFISGAEIVVGGGFDDNEGTKRPANPDAHLGTMTVGRSWFNTSVAVGTFPGSDGRYGTSDDIIAHGGKSSVFSTIDEISIGSNTGVAAVVAEGLSSSSGIVAEYIRSISIFGTDVTLKSGPLNDLVSLDSKGGFFAREIAFGNAG